MCCCSLFGKTVQARVLSQLGHCHQVLCRVPQTTEGQLCVVSTRQRKCQNASFPDRNCFTVKWLIFFSSPGRGLNVMSEYMYFCWQRVPLCVHGDIWVWAGFEKASFISSFKSSDGVLSTQAEVVRREFRLKGVGSNVTPYYKPEWNYFWQHENESVH